MSAAIALSKGKAYSWQITSINAIAEITSDTFSFSTPGELVDNFVPYAAEITMTFDSNANTLEVSWIGNHEDGDSLLYDLLIKEGENEIINEVDIETNNFYPIDTVPLMEYTVEIRSKDSSGNISVSTQSRTSE